jgi:hypothetical protein
MHGPVDPANILERPGPDRMAVLDPAFGQRFLVTIDTEEEFDWSAPFARESTGTSAAARIAEFQHFCEVRGVVPVWLVDWPIATSPAAASILRPAAHAGKAEIGVQLHPWVSPPRRGSEPVQQLCRQSSRRARTREVHEPASRPSNATFGVSPAIYRAGRYGVGPAQRTSAARRNAALCHRHLGARPLSTTADGRAGLPRPPDHAPTGWTRGRPDRTAADHGLLGPLLRGSADWLYPRLWRVPRCAARWRACGCWNAFR